ncbi:MAG: GNAT family N-acetyltransferase [Bauldia sp.]
MSLLDPAERAPLTQRATSAVGRTSDRSGRPRGFAVVPGEAAEGIAAEWADLAEHAAADNVFFDPCFAIPAIDHLGCGAVAVATVASADGRLVAAAPFTRMRLGHIAPAVSLWSNPYGPVGMPLVRLAVVDSAVAALVEGLAPGQKRESLIVPDLPLDGEVVAALVGFAVAGGRPVDVIDRRERAALVRPADGVIDSSALLPPRRRKEYGRLMRRLSDLGTVSIETTADPDRIGGRFEEFLALEAAGWKGRRGTALASSLATAEFARTVVFNCAEAGGARIDSIRLDAHPLAVLVSFIAGRTAFTWKIAYDEAYARFSPGALLMIEAPKGLFADRRVARIDSCAAAHHPMINHLWPGRTEVGTLVIGPPGGGALHRLGLAAAKAEIAARAQARRLRNRVS